MAQTKRVGIINSGGDCAGLNAVIASIVKSGIPQGYEFFGFIKGYEGLLDGSKYMILDNKAVSGITHLGGTILQTTNKGNFVSKIGEGGKSQIDPDVLRKTKENYQKLGLDCLVIIGGDGTLSSAIQLQESGINVVGVPKSIDNDLNATERTFGFSSAVDFVSDALDRVHTTAVSHDRVIITEVMGRNTGWIALYGGIAGGADMILLPEIKFNYEKVISFLRDRKSKGKNYTVVVVAEGAAADGEEQKVLRKEAGKENLLGGISMAIMDRIEELAPKEFEIRNLVLGHLQRGGAPDAEDRILSQRYGVAAMEAIKLGKFGHMVSLHGEDVSLVELADAVGSLKLVTPDHSMVVTAKKLGISFGN